MEMNDPFDISIPGLDEKQMFLLDCIWECETEAKFLEWFAILSDQERDQVICLQQLVLYAYIDNITANPDPVYKEANEVIDRVRRLQ